MLQNSSLTKKYKGDNAMNGLDVFVKYAFPPNRLGYCGPQKSDLFFQIFTDIKEKQKKGVKVKTKLLKELRNLSEQFKAATLYLEIIAKTYEINDIFDKQVVEAYWLGNDLLNNVEFKILYKGLEEKNINIFLNDSRQNDNCQIVTDAKNVILKAKPHHTFHVLNIYTQKEFTLKNYKIILEAIDNCRIRWGIVENICVDNKIKDFYATIDVKYFFLEFDKYGNLVLEKEMIGKFFTINTSIKIGDIVSLHYDFICDKLTLEQKSNLIFWTNYHLAIFNSCRDNILL